MNPIAGCGITALLILASIAWIVCLLASLVSRPESDERPSLIPGPPPVRDASGSVAAVPRIARRATKPKMRVIEKLLIATSIVMIFAVILAGSSVLQIVRPVTTMGTSRR